MANKIPTMEKHKMRIMKRIDAMKKHREKCGIEKRWKQADIDCELRPLSGEKKMIGQDFSANRVRLDDSDWQSDNSSGVAFEKVTIALNVLIDKLPEIKNLKPKKKEYGNRSALIQALYKDSVKNEMMQFKLKRTVLNQAKYGVAFGVTYSRYDSRKVKNLVGYDVVKNREVYRDDLVEDYNGAWFEPLNNFDTWWDERAKPYDILSMDDWCRRVRYTKTEVIEKFGSDVLESIINLSNDGDNEDEDMFCGYIYECKSKDKIAVILRGRLVLYEPMPIKKQLSLSYSIWQLRNAETIDGVGLPETIRQDKNLREKIENMAVDQLVLSIYKSFFYDASFDADSDGEMQIRPNRGQAVMDPQKVRFLDISGPGAEVYNKIDRLEVKMDRQSAIFPNMAGQALENKTAFEIETVNNSSMRRLSTPLDGLRFMLLLDALMRIEIIKLTMSNVDVEKIVDWEDVARYVSEADEGDYVFDSDSNSVYVYKYPELMLPLQDKNGVIVESDEHNFFKITPDLVLWDGEFEIEFTPTLDNMPEMRKRRMLEFSNLVVPLLSGDPAINLKPVMRLAEAFEQDYREWIPEAWTQNEPQLDRTKVGAAIMNDKNRGNMTIAKENTTERIGTMRKIVQKLGRVFTHKNTSGDEYDS